MSSGFQWDDVNVVRSNHTMAVWLRLIPLSNSSRLNKYVRLLIPLDKASICIPDPLACKICNVKISVKYAYKICCYGSYILDGTLSRSNGW